MIKIILWVIYLAAFTACAFWYDWHLMVIFVLFLTANNIEQKL